MQAARESAHRASCTNNLKQIALAVQEYNDSQGCFPALGHPRQGTAGIRSPRWQDVQLAGADPAALEQTPLYSQFDFNRTVLQQPANPQAAQLPTLLCPSETSSGQFFTDPVITQGKRFGKGNYAAYVSPVSRRAAGSGPGSIWLASAGRVIGSYRRRAVEHDSGFRGRTRDDEQDQRGAWAIAWTAASLLAFDMHSSGRPFSYYRYAAFSLGLTQLPNNQGPEFDMLYVCPESADAQLAGMPCNTWDPTFNTNHYLSAAPRSQHPGGVNVAFLDGHTGFLRSNRANRSRSLIAIDDGMTASLGD